MTYLFFRHVEEGAGSMDYNISHGVPVQFLLPALYFSSWTHSELELPMDTGVPAQVIFLCYQDCLARTESERAFYAAAKRSPPARLFILKR